MGAFLTVVIFGFIVTFMIYLTMSSDEMTILKDRARKRRIEKQDALKPDPHNPALLDNQPSSVIRAELHKYRQKNNGDAPDQMC